MPVKEYEDCGIYSIWKNQMSHGWGQSYQSNSRPYTSLWWGEVGHNIDRCIIAHPGNGFPLLADLNARTPPGFLTMLQLKYNNGSTGIVTIESSSFPVPGVDAGKQHPVRVYGLKISILETSDIY